MKGCPLQGWELEKKICYNLTFTKKNCNQYTKLSLQAEINRLTFSATSDMIVSISGEKNLTCGALIFVVLAALSISQAVIITLAHGTPVVLDTTLSFAACCL